MRIPPGKEVALKGTILLGHTTNTTEGTVEDNIIRANDSQLADWHGEATEARAHLFPSVGGRIVDNTEVDIKTASASRIDEAREARSISLVATE